MEEKSLHLNYKSQNTFAGVSSSLRSTNRFGVDSKIQVMKETELARARHESLAEFGADDDKISAKSELPFEKQMTITINNRISSKRVVTEMKDHILMRVGSQKSVMLAGIEVEDPILEEDENLQKSKSSGPPKTGVHASILSDKAGYKAGYKAGGLSIPAQTGKSSPAKNRQNSPSKLPKSSPAKNREKKSPSKLPKSSPAKNRQKSPSKLPAKSRSKFQEVSNENILFEGKRPNPRTNENNIGDEESVSFSRTYQSKFNHADSVSHLSYDSKNSKKGELDPATYYDDQKDPEDLIGMIFWKILGWNWAPLGGLVKFGESPLKFFGIRENRAAVFQVPVNTNFFRTSFCNFLSLEFWPRIWRP